MKKLSEFLKVDNINLNLKSKTKEEIFMELTDIIEKELSDKEEFYQDLLDRELAGSTALEYGLSIPHVRSKYVKDFIVGVGVSKEGVYCDSIDGENSKLFFIIATNNKYNDYHIQTLSNIVKMVNSEKIVDILTNTHSKEGFIHLIEELENILETK